MARIPELRYIIEVRPEAEVLAERADAEAWRTWRPFLADYFRDMAEWGESSAKDLREGATSCREAAAYFRGETEAPSPNPTRSFAIGDRVRVRVGGRYKSWTGRVTAYGHASHAYSVKLDGLTVTKTFADAELEHEVMFP